ncbi:hypothetical protein XM38_011770 [Halomicronema hongdechloris C2206]|uniref:Uncharacterized protein n=1 Tax=Halomicronema hongdechloris C2206 TaxID=1641165 RepID=A0A1Z3HIW4_9CYAN|nr:phosphorylase [Halomicronema hongdechloris]ASC70241.1 hypothetical protein XM38_011770 [Halomicronema hongdechloris C2206]
MALSSPPPRASDRLWPRVQTQTQHALACGALQPIDTRYQFLEQAGMWFLVRILANLVRKERAKRQQPRDFNPFLPYEEDLFVANLSETHVCLLNKFNVVAHHILIITRAFEEQDSWLTLADFQALAVAMAEIDGLGFYNSGTRAGASQRHKHLQLVPLPLAPEAPAVPLNALIAEAMPAAVPDTVPSLPFQHRIVSLSLDWSQPMQAAARLLATYGALLTALGVSLQTPQPSAPYNLLLTHQWMMVVVRSQESYRSIPVNSLGFAGSLLVKNPDQLALLKAVGPMTLLRQVAYPANA